MNDNLDRFDKVFKVISIVSPILAVLCICFFIFNEYGHAPATAHGTTPTDTEISTVTVEIVTESTVLTTVEQVAQTESITVTKETEETAEIELAYNEYTEEFFDNILFIGDSISSGISGFEYLPPQNVFTKIGLNPSSALADKILDITDKNKVEKTVVEKAVEFDADYLCIMLGTNGMNYLEPEYMLEKMQLLIDELKLAVPNSKLVLMTIPPVTYEYETDDPDNIKLASIQKYNELLTDMAQQNDCILVDIYSSLCDETGYYDDRYVDADGLHCHANAYLIILHEVQMAIMQSKNKM